MILINEAGGIPINLGVVPDESSAIGGASIGEKDYVLETVKQLGEPEIIIRGIKVQPGRVTSLCVIRGKPIVMLPGHFQSTLVGFYTVLLPLIRVLIGMEPTGACLIVRARLFRKIIVRGFLPFERVRFVKLVKSSEGYPAEPNLGSSSLISIVTNSDGFIIIPGGKDVIDESERVDVRLLRGLYPFR